MSEAHTSRASYYNAQSSTSNTHDARFARAGNSHLILGTVSARGISRRQKGYIALNSLSTLPR